jgi:hypothetical protein
MSPRITRNAIVGMILLAPHLAGQLPTELHATNLMLTDVPSSDVRVGVGRDPGHPTKPWILRSGDINRANCPPRRYHQSGVQRAGHPNCVAPWACCSTSSHYSGGFVGGGALLGGLSRRADAGTWGVDYHGWLSPRGIFLNWTCGDVQGGEGAYETDGEPPIVTAAKDRVHDP